MDSVFESVAGLPLHPLVVHVVVVLVPVAGLGAVAMAIWPGISRRVGSLFVIAAGLGAGGAFVAKASGEAFAEVRGTPATHAQLGDVMPWFALALFVVLLVFGLVDRGIPSNRPRPVWLRLFAVVLVIVAVATIAWVVRTGHTGAEAVWSGVVDD